MLSSLSVTAALGAVLLGAPALEPGAMGRAEVRAGSAPVEPGGEAKGALVLQGEPTVAMRLRWPRMTLTSRYGPRFFYRVPNAAELGRPLVLHQGALVYEGRLERDLDARVSIDSRIGEVDYTSAAIIFNPAQPSLSEVPVFKLFEVHAASELGFALSPRTRLAWLASASHAEPLGTNEAFPSLTSFGTGATYTERLDRRNRLQLPVYVQHHAFGTGERLLASEAGASFLRRLDRKSDVEVAAGAVEVEHLQGGGSRELLPTASVTATHGFLDRRSERLRGGLHVALLAVLDTINAEYTSVAGAAAALELGLRPRWRLGARVAVYTDLEEDNAGGGPRDYRARVSAELPIIYRFTRTAFLEFGGRSEARAPGFAATDWALREVQLWAYVAATVAFGTDRTQGHWLL